MARPDGAWASYALHPADPEVVLIFGSELAALRDAVANGRKVARWEYGTSIRDADAARLANAVTPAPRARQARKAAQRDPLPGTIDEATGTPA
jgi:hypothetical protein